MREYFKPIICSAVLCSILSCTIHGLPVKIFHSNNPRKCTFKRLRENDSFKMDGYKFYRVSEKNISNYLKDTNQVLIHYFLFCSANKHIPSQVNKLSASRPDLQIYLLTTDLTTNLEEDVEYFKKHNFSQKIKILFLDYKLYKKGNWRVKYQNFVKNICPDYDLKFCNSNQLEIIRNDSGKFESIYIE